MAVIGNGIGKSFDGWVRTILLGFSIGAAWYTIKGDIALVAQELQSLTGANGRIEAIELRLHHQSEALDAVIGRQLARLAVFDKMIVTVEKHNERIHSIESLFARFIETVEKHEQRIHSMEMRPQERSAR